MTHAETIAYNAGVRAVLAVVEEAGERIANSSKRSALFREIAGAAFEQLVEDGAALLLPIGGTQAAKEHGQ